MAADPIEPPRDVPADGGVVHELSAEVHPLGTPERFGPVTVQRFVKVGDRALILYERTPPGPPDR